MHGNVLGWLFRAVFVMREGWIICMLQADSSGRAASCWGGRTETRSLVPGGEIPPRHAFKAECEAEGKFGAGAERGDEWNSGR